MHQLVDDGPQLKASSALLNRLVSRNTMCGTFDKVHTNDTVWGPP